MFTVPDNLPREGRIDVWIRYEIEKLLCLLSFPRTEDTTAIQYLPYR
jgi:hypothetical protein